MNTVKSPNLSEVALSYRTKVKAKDRLKISRSADAYEALKGIFDMDTIEHHEEFVILLLNRAMRVLGWAKISVGGITAAVVDGRVVFQHALLANATGLILSHNHPSGLVTPSEQDKSITKKLVEMGKLFDIEIKDHLIFAKDGYYSFADESDI